MPRRQPPRALALLVVALTVGATACMGGGDALDRAAPARPPAPTAPDAPSSLAPTTSAPSGSTPSTALSPSTTGAAAGAAASTTAPSAGPATTRPAPAPTTRPAPATTAPAPTAPPATTRAPAAPTTAAPPPAPATTAAPTGTTSGNWEITVYFTPLESNYPGPATAISGCPNGWCSGAGQALGSYSSVFLDHVQVEGVGRLSSGPHAGRYLNWSSDVGDSGYYLTDAPASASGESLAPRQSAASPSLPFGTRFVISDCGRNENGSAVDTAACNDLKTSTWRVVDRFGSPTGSRHLDLYIGVEQPGQRMEDSPLYQSWKSVTITQL